MAKIEEMKKSYPQFFEDSDESEYDETPEEKELRIALKIRNRKNSFLKKVEALVTSATFNFIIFLLIIGNTITLAAYTFD